MEIEMLRSELQVSPIFTGVDTSGMTVCEQRFTSGQNVPDAAEGIPSIGVVLEGTINAFSVAPDGNSVLLNNLERGDCFGISNLFGDEPLETILISTGNSRAVFVPKEEYARLCRNDSAIAMRYAEICNRKLQFLLKRISILTTQTSRGRLLSYLLIHAGEDGNVFLNGSRDSLASAVNISRAALYRELRYLTDRGILELKKRSLRIVDRSQISQMLSEMD